MLRGLPSPEEPREKTSLALARTVASLGFVMLLTVPGMPAFMSRPSWIALTGWVAMGLVFFLLRAQDFRSLSKQELDQLILKSRCPRVELRIRIG